MFKVVCGCGWFCYHPYEGVALNERAHHEKVTGHDPEVKDLQEDDTDE